MLHRYQFIFIHREVAPVGPPFFEFLISKIWGKKIIYDFDDAIWLPNTSASNSISAGLKFHHKVAYICKTSWKVSVGNKFLKQYALKYNEKVIVNPTVVDTENHHFKVKKHHPVRMPVIGWTGTHSTSRYLKKIEPTLLELKKEMDFKLVIISNQPPELNNIDFEFIPWQKEHEIDQLLAFDIGIMPLEDNIWEEGKCGFKIIQYFSLGIPAVASPVGVNVELIDQEVNGYLAASKSEWKDALRKLLERHNLRAELGKNGRDKIVNHYSVLRNKDLYFSSFE